MKARLPFEIIHEDRDLIVISKPAGLLTSSLYSDERCTAQWMLGDYLRKGQQKSRKAAYLIHRLDRETSGVMAFAKSEKVAEFFRSDWQNRSKKLYLARVEGVLEEEEGVFESYLADNDRTMKVASVADPKKGKYACTLWRKLDVSADSTLVEVTLKSGRKNQIRVHFSEAGHPVVGDVKYGARKAPRMMLHSHKLALIHPHTKKWMEFSSPCGQFGDLPPAVPKNRRP